MRHNLDGRTAVVEDSSSRPLTPTTPPSPSPSPSASDDLVRSQANMSADAGSVIGVIYAPLAAS